MTGHISFDGDDDDMMMFIFLLLNTMYSTSYTQYYLFNAILITKDLFSYSQSSLGIANQ